MTSFTSAVLLDRATLAALKAGTRTLPTGQWVRGLDGRLGQFIGADLRGDTRVVAVSWVKEGESFTDRTQRFARAIWHRRDKHDPVTAVLKAPSSVDLPRLKEHFAAAFA